MSEVKVFTSFEGPEGVRVEVFDESLRYGYANIFLVRLRVRGSFPGSEETFERTLEKMGVFAEDLEATKTGLVDSFRKSTLPYLAKAGFAEKLKARREECEKPKRPQGFGGYRCS